MEGKGRARPRQATKKEKGGVERDKRGEAAAGGEARFINVASAKGEAATKGEYGAKLGVGLLISDVGWYHSRDIC